MGCTESKETKDRDFDGLPADRSIRRKGKKGKKGKGNVPTSNELDDSERAKDAAKRRRVSAKEFHSAKAEKPCDSLMRSKRGGKGTKGKKGKGGKRMSTAMAESKLSSISSGDEDSLEAAFDATVGKKDDKHLPKAGRDRTASDVATPDTAHSLATPDTTDSEQGPANRTRRKSEGQADAFVASLSMGGGASLTTEVLNLLPPPQAQTTAQQWVAALKKPSASQLCGEKLAAESSFETPEREGGAGEGDYFSRDGEDVERSGYARMSANKNPLAGSTKHVSEQDDHDLEQMLRGGGSDTKSSRSSSANSEWMYNLDELNKDFEKRKEVKAEIQRRKESKRHGHHHHHHRSRNRLNSESTAMLTESSAMNSHRTRLNLDESTGMLTESSTIN